MMPIEQRNNLQVARSNDLPGSSGGSAAKKRRTDYGPESVETWAKTEIEKETFAFFWNLRSYSSFGGSEVKSPVFRGGPKSNHGWQLKLCQKKMSDGHEYFTVHLILADFGDGETPHNRKIKARFQISILDADGIPGRQAGSSTMNPIEFKQLSVWGYDKFILSTDLVSPTRRLVEDDSLKIHCRVWIEGELKHKTYNGGAAHRSLPAEEKDKRRKERLSTDFGKLLKVSMLTDFTIKTEKNAFLAHKAILAARSSVFSAMFAVNINMKDAEILEFDDTVVRGMLEHMYSGETGLLFERAPKLLQVAEKYGLPGLKEDCEYVMAENLNFENAAEVLVMANMYNASILKPRVIDYINRNEEEVRKTKSFEKVVRAHPSVFVDLYLSR